MKIGLDYQTAAGRGGNARYTHELAQHLAALKDGALYLYDYVHDVRKKSLLPSEAHARFVYLTPPYAPRNIRGVNELITKVMSRIDGIEVFHFTNPQNVVSGPFRSVVTVHDMSTYTERDFAKAESHSLLEQKLELIRDADAIIAVSQHTKSDLTQRFGVDQKKITVIYEAAGEEFYPDPDRAAADALGASRFILYAGQLQPRKNIIRLIEAFASVHSEYPDVSLVLVGVMRDEEYRREVQSVIAKRGIEGAVVFTGRVSDSALRQLYSTTECFVYPSLFEGFGLPPLEAMRCGAPVVVSNASSLPEVVGDAGVTIDPLDGEALTNALMRVVADDKFRAHLREKSIARAVQFSWERAAQETAAVYRTIAA